MMFLRVRRAVGWEYGGMYFQSHCSNGIKDWWACIPGYLLCLAPKQKATVHTIFLPVVLPPHLTTYVPPVLSPPNFPLCELWVNHLEIIKFNKVDNDWALRGRVRSSGSFLPPLCGGADNVLKPRQEARKRGEREAELPAALLPAWRIWQRIRE